jgi:hypothetical protein
LEKAEITLVEGGSSGEGERIFHSLDETGSAHFRKIFLAFFGESEELRGARKRPFGSMPFISYQEPFYITRSVKEMKLTGYRSGGETIM